MRADDNRHEIANADQLDAFRFEQRQGLGKTLSVRMLEILERTQPDDHPDLQRARELLAEYGKPVELEYLHTATHRGREAAEGDTVIYVAQRRYGWSELLDMARREKPAAAAAATAATAPAVAVWRR